MSLGVDTGGTFTDFVWRDRHGRLQLHKQRSTPPDPSAAILTGIDTLGIPADTAVTHGSTVATNALLERRGASTALITTKGFADVLAIGRQNRPDIYALVPHKPPPLVPGRWRLEVDERITAEGAVLTPLRKEDVVPLAQQIAAAEIESVAVCLLFSFLHPQHEETIAAVLADHAPDVAVSLSSRILPEYREYERTATTVINAYVAPLMARYLRRLAEKIAPRPLQIMQSNGGLISADTAGAEAARTALSGPAGGVVGAQFVAAQAGYPHIITFDMGGTSTDAALCPGRLPTTSRAEMAGLPLRLPVIDIHTVGAGGGSLAYVDAGGGLHVGPESAGADPGPVCYPAVLSGPADDNPSTPPRELPGRVTVTDANLMLGRLDADHFLGGEMGLNLSAAHAALDELAGQMGVGDGHQAAWGVLRVANAHMERAIRKISVERGYDPRQFTLVPFGGAGPLHACELAEQLRIPRVLVPPTPGVLSALGMLVADPTKDYSRTVLHTAAPDTDPTELTDWLHETITPLRERATAEMTAEGHAADAIEYAITVDMRYRGQSHELSIRHAADEDLVTAFHAAHDTRYGYARPQEPVELVTLRLSAVVSAAEMVLPRPDPAGETTAETAVIGRKQAWFDGEMVETTLYARDQLRPGHTFRGPAVVFQYDTTIVIPPAWSVTVDEYGNLVAESNSG